MKQTIKVTIKSVGNTWQVSNDRGKIWTHMLEYNSNQDTSRNAMIAAVASGMLTATIAAHLAHTQAEELTYELTVNEE